MTGSASLLQEGKAEEALAALKNEVRTSPSDLELRSRLFALHCVLGRWDKSLNDLSALKAMDPSWTIAAQVYENSIGAESVRRDVFAGRAKPVIMGEPQEWIAWNVQAIALEAAAKAEEATDLRARAFEAAPEYACDVNGQKCQWISDADRRLGPILEAYLDGQYYWIPFGQLQKIDITAPEFLVESVWLPARLLVAGGAELAAQLPARYPGTESSTDGALCLGRRTEWVRGQNGDSLPLGQKLIESNDGEFGLLECRVIAFEPPEQEQISAGAEQ